MATYCRSVGSSSLVCAGVHADLLVRIVSPKHRASIGFGGFFRGWLYWRRRGHLPIVPRSEQNMTRMLPRVIVSPKKKSLSLGYVRPVHTVAAQFMDQ